MRGLKDKEREKKRLFSLFSILRNYDIATRIVIFFVDYYDTQCFEIRNNNNIYDYKFIISLYWSIKA